MKIAFLVFLVNIILARQLRIDLEDCPQSQPVSPQQFFSGRTNKWIDDPQAPSIGIYVDVDISVLNLKNTPLAFTTLTGRSTHWATTGATSVYNMTKDGFKVYLKYSNGGLLTAKIAK